MRTIAVDFDGVIHRYSRGWHDGTVYDPPVENAVASLKLLMRQFSVFIFTTRDVDQVHEWMTSNCDIPCVADANPSSSFWNSKDTILITNKKLAAIAYIDDRAITFFNWEQALDELWEVT